jgi:hypothetical protein
MIKSERIPVGDLEGHAMSLLVRGAFMVFEDGEVAVKDHVNSPLAGSS